MYNFYLFCSAISKKHESNTSSELNNASSHSIKKIENTILLDQYLSSRGKASNSTPKSEKVEK